MPKPSVIRFGPFAADLGSGELRREGVKIRLQSQPFQLLTLLLLRPGEVVTRDEIREKLWAADTFVDFDHSLGTAVNKIREALSDSADHPRFVETMPRRGYRFIGTLNGSNGSPASESRPAPSNAYAGVTIESVDNGIETTSLPALQESGVLSLQLLHPFGLIQLQPPIFLSPAVVRLYGDFGFLAGLRGGLSVRNSYFNLTQQRHNLLCFVSLHRHVQLSFRVILSHSRWTHLPRPRHGQHSYLQSVLGVLVCHGEKTCFQRLQKRQTRVNFLMRNGQTGNPG
jgi:DNA-binding winged helix-turn-helix (wHTH) protein